MTDNGWYAKKTPPKFLFIYLSSFFFFNLNVDINKRHIEIVFWLRE